MPIRRLLPLALTLALTFAPAFALEPTPAPPSQAPAHESETYRQHIYFLSNPFMEGRGPGTKGNEIAAEYIERRFQTLSLDAPIMLDGADIAVPDSKPKMGYQQEFEAGVQVRSGICFIREPQTTGPLNVITDNIVPLGFSGAATVKAPLVFVGYAIQNGGPDKSYSTFAESDGLSGTIAIMLRFEPMNGQGASKWKSQTDSGPWSPTAALAAKVQEVVKRKPAAIVLVNTPGADDPRIARLDAIQETARWMRELDIPAVLVGPAGAEAIVHSADPSASLQALKQAADARGGIVPLGNHVLELRAAASRSPRTTSNIAATLPGSGALADQYILIGAHYDHVGYGYTGGSRTDEYGIVHPGADDNASGTSGHLLAAEILKQRFARLGEPGHPSGLEEPGDPEAPRRSIMFVAFSAEEMGLIGSREFIKDSPVPASAMYAMLNMDMIGRLRENKLEVSGTGTAAGFDEFLKPFFDSSGLTVKASPGGRGPSDHATFYGARVPVLAFFTGLHEEYHTPRDTPDLINIDGAVKVVHLACDIAAALALRPGPLEFQTTDKVTSTDPAAPQASMSNVKVRFGIAPGNYADDQPGVLVGEVYPGTCAAEAGILPNDRLVRWAGEPIADVAHWMTFLAKHKPGDVVDITILRAAQEQTVRITLKSRDQAAK